MIKVNFDPSKLTGPLKAEWQAWEQKASKATEDVIDAWETWRAGGSVGEFKYRFDEKIWKELKDWLIKNVFHNKCAYCETREVRSSYHAEHFRPKAAVTVKGTGKRKQQTCLTVDEYGNNINHPGYFWLAYTWSNLLPSCHYCNSVRGKKNQFPIKNAHISVKLLTAAEAGNLNNPMIKTKVASRGNVYYLQPEDLTPMEDPLLLHPYFDKPQDHLTFGEFGEVSAKDEKGQHSIEVYNLDAEPLVTARREAQYIVRQDYEREVSRGKYLSRQQRRAIGRAFIAGYINGEEPYSAAVMAELRAEYSDHGL